jgi:hypothetical protein
LTPAAHRQRSSASATPFEALNRFDDTDSKRDAASTTQVPPVALFEFNALQVSFALRANNATSGTLHAEARRTKTRV